MIVAMQHGAEDQCHALRVRISEQQVRDAISIARVSADPRARDRVNRAEKLLNEGRYSAAWHALRSLCSG